MTIFLIICLMNGCQEKTQLPQHIDHLVYTSPDLETGIREIEDLLGVRPVMGGSHPDYGTRNALLALGPSTYLEIIAPDPGLPVPDRGRLFQEYYEQPAKLTTWVLRTEHIESLRTDAFQKGLALGEVAPGQRKKPDGNVLSWKLTDPYALPLSGAIPFLISWGSTPHPAGSVPVAGELIELTIAHPNPELVREKLALLNTHPRVIHGDKVKLMAKIKTKNGIVTLE